MKKSDHNPFQIVQTILAFFVMSIIIWSCSKYNEDLSPATIVKTSKTVNDAYARLSKEALGPLDCSTLNGVILNNKYRSKVVSIYGVNAGPWYDGLASSYNLNPNAYSLNPAYAKVYNYKSQIINAIQKGSKNLFESYCMANTPACNLQGFWSAYLKDAIDVYLNPIKTAITNDGMLSVLEKGVLNGAIQSYYENFDEIINTYGVDGRNCFPHPSWYGSPGPSQAEFLAGLGKVLRKVINISATILTEVVEYAVFGALYGAIVGVPFAAVGAVPAAGVGAIVGGFVGLIDGIDRCMKGKYICLVSCI